jgi:hypothetical protein
MLMKPKALALAVLLAILALPALADQRPGRGPGGPTVDASVLTNPRFLARYLNLSPTQITQTQGFLKTLQTAVQAVQMAHAPLCQHLRTDLAVSSPDPATIGRDFLALVNNQAGIKTALAAFDTSFSNILNGDQLAKYNALKQLIGATGRGPDPLPVCPASS